MIKKMTLLVLCLLTLNLLIAGRYAGDFMSIGSGIKSLSMGGAFSSIADDGTAIYWNSAGISNIRSSEVILMRAYLYEGLANYDNISYCHPLPNEVTIGFNWTRLSIDDIPIFSENHLIGTNIDQRAAFEEFQLTAIPDGKFKSTDDLFQFAFSKHIHHDADLGWFLFVLPIDYHLGVNFKYIKRDMLEYTGDGTGFDVGFLIKTDLGILVDQEYLGKIACGVNLQDIGGTGISWDTQSKHKDEVLFNTKLGFSYLHDLKKYHSKLTVAYDKDYVYEKTDHFGLEWNYKDQTKFRLGYYDQNFSAGIGLKVSIFSLDYAFLTNNLGNTNRIGLSIRL